ncbi:hypothetical protein AYL99_00163 [Fonsecaea erecta]|uniref:Uncharacterized protein n=1 Tax=Fonsecaea erecta TaxID=1367422 RepID=A0A178ZXN5_9EURO|nr:hypothetical protein AYL99_00163 [Fonsecaea erecta]OAP64191.1 hypothetical protein AYL99_00163 [Fonsecaea erecta]
MDSNKASSTTEKSANRMNNSNNDDNKAVDKSGVLGNKEDFSARTKLAQSMAARVANGASLNQVAFQNNMTADQAGLLLSELVVRLSNNSIPQG